MFIKTAAMDWSANPITKIPQKERVNDSVAVVERNVQ